VRRANRAYEACWWNIRYSDEHVHKRLTELAAAKTEELRRRDRYEMNRVARYAKMFNLGVPGHPRNLGTRAGRLSCSDPNLSNAPRSADG
jgi:hypothetical protein